MSHEESSDMEQLDKKEYKLRTGMEKWIARICNRKFQGINRECVLLNQQEQENLGLTNLQLPRKIHALLDQSGYIQNIISESSPQQRDTLALIIARTENAVIALPYWHKADELIHEKARKSC